MKFIKLQYHNEIKKILLKKEDLSYEELYNMILNSFFKKKDSLKLIIKYKDLENQEIAINNNQELGLALNLFYFQKFIKFIVYSSKILEKADPQKEKIENSDLPEKSLDVLSIDINELQTILSAAFDESNLTTRLENHIFSLIEKKGITPSNISKYEIKTDFNCLSSYFQQFLQTKMDDVFSKIKLKLDEKEDPPQIKNELSIINNSDIINHISFSEANFAKDVHLLKKEEDEENKEETENSKKPPISEAIPVFKINLDDDKSILESIYELVDREEIESLPEFSPLTKSKSDNYETRRADILSITMQNNGKMKFTSKTKQINEEKNPHNKPLFNVKEISFDEWKESKK